MTMRARGVALFACWMAALVCSCDRRVPIGALALERDAAADALPAATWPWSADHEAGDLSQWLERTTTTRGGVFRARDSAAVEVVSDVARSGRFAARTTIQTDGISVRYAKLFRQEGLPDEARYGAWFYLPRDVHVGQYWNIMQWTDASGMLFDLGLVTRNGRLEVYAHDHQRGERVPYAVGALPAVPTGRWFELAAVFRKATDATGFVTVFQDGMPIVDHRNLATVADPASVAWNVGSAALDVGSTPVVLYVDDASIVPR